MVMKTQAAKTVSTKVKGPSKSGKSLMTAGKKKASKVQMQDVHFTRQRGKKA